MILLDIIGAICAILLLAIAVPFVVVIIIAVVAFYYALALCIIFWPLLVIGAVIYLLARILIPVLFDH